MTSLTQNSPSVSPNVIAGLLLAARTTLRQLDLPHPSVAQILAATSAGRTRAYEYKTAILSQLQEHTRPVGRPPSVSSPPIDTGTLSRRVLRFVMDHPGCVSHRGTERQRYSDDLRDFMLDLWGQEQAKMDLTTFTEAVQIPLGTFKDWLRLARPSSVEATLEDKNTITEDNHDMKNEPTVTSTQLETICAEWKSWRGDFISFCDHLQQHLRLPHGRTLIANILEQLGVRIPQRRRGRSPDEKALRDAFETFFPGAQWTGDGSPIIVRLVDQKFIFNLELMVDTDSAAFVGASACDEEDSAAVTTAFEDGVQTTGEPPLCLLLDLRSCNHTDQVNQTLGDTLNMPATKGRPQNKAHVEGGFGLFQQTIPPLEIKADSPREQARQLLQLVTQTWARTLNHKPRPRHHDQSRVEQYKTSSPTPEQIHQAKTALENRLQKQRQALKTIKARTDPVTRQILEDAFVRLDLVDPTGNLTAAIARYPIDAILAGIATFEGKRGAKTLPEGVDARYLFGIVKNIALQHEGFLISESLLRARLQAKDLMLRGLQQERSTLMQSPLAIRERLHAFIQRALDTERRIDRLFWLQTTADFLRSQTQDLLTELWHSAYRRIHSAFRIPYDDRAFAVHYLAAKVVPLD